MQKYEWAFPTSEWTEQFMIQSRWNLSKKSTREFLTAPRPFL
jgi:hypothetical protein